MIDSVVKPMPKEICCKNWVELFNYIETSPNLPNGLSGRDAIEMLLDGLIDNPKYLIQDPSNPEHAMPVKEKHLTDKKFWHSNEFSIKLLANASKVIGGYRPLFQAGIFAGYNMFKKNQPKHLQFLRLFSPNMFLKIAKFVNSKLNKTKNPNVIQTISGYSKINLNYHDKFKNNITSNVCDWNAGIYTGMGQYSGAHDIMVVEKACITRGDQDCIFEMRWTHLNFFRRLLIFIHSII